MPGPNNIPKATIPKSNQPNLDEGLLNAKFEQNNYYPCTYSSQGSSIFLFMGEANGINFQFS